jgi:hypothetical protein
MDRYGLGTLEIRRAAGGRPKGRCGYTQLETHSSPSAAVTVSQFEVNLALLTGD